MSRSYRKIRPNVSMVYSVAEVQALYGICRNTMSNWVSGGLQPSDSALPQVFRGAELKRFHAERAARKRGSLRHGEFKCMGCGHAVFPGVSTVSLSEKDNGIALAHATCCDCGGIVLKRLGATECDKVKECLVTNTSLARIDEGKVVVPACVGKDAGSQGVEWVTINDRIVHDWQAYAGRYDRKTVLAHLVSIRDFERFLGGLAFRKVTQKHALAYRDRLVELNARAKDKGGLSNSTVRHRASHVGAFFKWLRGQDLYRRMSASIPDCFALPRTTSAAPLARDRKAYPSLEDAWRMVELMPTKTRVQRRDQAMVAFAFVSGLRAGALSSLCFMHLDMDKKTVVQDAKDMRAKNGKSYKAQWFPRTDAFQEVFVGWVREQIQFGFKEQDAVFPEVKDLVARSADSPIVAPMGTSSALQTAFCRASEPLGTSYSPHSARHTLAALGALICRTQRERKAWSLNLGHAEERVTERHYGKMSQSQSAAIIEGLCSEEIFTEDETATIIDYYEARFQHGTEEYWMARRLAERREKARGDGEVIE